MLTREDILGLSRPLGTLKVDEWGGDVALRKLGALEVVDVGDEKQAGRRTILLVRYGVATADGAPMFTAEDDAWLAGQPWDLMLRVAGAVSEFSGLSTPAETVSGN